MSFKECWLIPRDIVADFLEYRDKVQETAQDSTKMHQEGGGAGGNVLMQEQLNTAPKTTTRHNLVKNYLNQERYRKQQPSLPPNVNDFPKTNKPSINISLVSSFFPEMDRYKVAYVLNYINQKLAFKIQIDKQLNLIINNQYLWNSSIADVLKFLFGIERRYITEKRKVKYKDIVYGIPEGTDEFVDVLKGFDRNISKLSFDPVRLKILKLNATTDSESEDDDEDDHHQDQDITLLQDDDGDDNDDEDNGNDGGNGGGRSSKRSSRREDFVTPDNKSSSSKRVRPAQKSLGYFNPDNNKGTDSPQPPSDVRVSTPMPASTISSSSVLLPPVEEEEDMEEEGAMGGRPLTPPDNSDDSINYSPMMDEYTHQALMELGNSGHSLRGWAQNLHKKKKSKLERERERLNISSKFSPPKSTKRSRRKKSMSPR